MAIEIIIRGTDQCRMLVGKDEDTFAPINGPADHRHIDDPAIDDKKIQDATLDDVNTSVKRFLSKPAVTGVLTPVMRKPGEIAPFAAAKTP